MPGWLLLSFVAPKFLTPYLLHFFASLLPEFRREFFLYHAAHVVFLFLRVRNDFFAVGVFALGGCAVCEVEGKMRGIPDGNVINPVNENMLIEFIDSKHVAYELLQMILAQALARTDEHPFYDIKRMCLHIGRREDLGMPTLGLLSLFMSVR